MNDYDDSDDYSSANSFRARSNTWPLNRPDLAVPNSVDIDETLPEIEIEEDDLFTTNENWSTGLVADHDIMSWDPILNAQSHHHHHHHHHQQQQQQHHQQHHQPTATTTSHQHNPHQHHQAANAVQANIAAAAPPTQASVLHPQQHPQQRQQPTIHQPQTHHHHHHHHQQSQPHDTLLGGPALIMGGQVQQPPPPPHQRQQHQPQQLPPQHHQTLNNTHCLDADDPNEYHIHQLHHLRLDGNQPAPSAAEHQPPQHYISSLTPVCIQGSTSTLGTENYNISSDHQHHHLQPVPFARYDLDQQSDLDLKDLKTHDNDHQQSQQQAQHHLHHLTSTSIDHHQPNSHLLSSSLSTSGMGLNGELEDLDYKVVYPPAILHSPQFDEQQQQQQDQPNESGSSKQSSSTTSSKTKLNTPRRNAWGNMSYADLISQAINSTNDKRLTLSQIYDWMVQHVPYFKDKGDSNSSAGWKNSVRHNLSLHNRFKRLQNEGTGKSSWWTINPEANIGKCARRRAASMEASKYEKKRGRAKKKAEAVRMGLVSYPSLTNSSLTGSSSALEQQPPSHHQSANQFGPQQQQPAPPPPPPPQQQQADGLNYDNLHNRQPNTGLYVASAQNSQYEQTDNKMQQQQQQQQQQQPPQQFNDLICF